jgi:hypothetical protein
MVMFISREFDEKSFSDTPQPPHKNMEKNKQNESKVGGSVAEPSRKSKRGAGIAADPVESPPNESDRRRERIGKPISVSKQTRFDKLPPKKAAATVDEGEEEWEEAENGADKMIRSTEKRNVPSSLNMDREKSPGPGSGTRALDVLPYVKETFTLRALGLKPLENKLRLRNSNPTLRSRFQFYSEV